MSALGIEVSGISLPSKKVTLKGFNGLKGGVQITTFDLPSNDPNGGIHLTLNAATTNVSIRSARTGEDGTDIPNSPRKSESN